MKRLSPLFITLLLLGACGGGATEPSQSVVSSIVLQNDRGDEAAMVFDYEQGELRAGELRTQNQTIGFSAVVDPTGLQTIAFDDGATISFQREGEKLQRVEWMTSASVIVRSLRYQNEELVGWSDEQDDLRVDVGVIRDRQGRWTGMTERFFGGGEVAYDETTHQFVRGSDGQLDEIGTENQSATYLYDGVGRLSSASVDEDTYHLTYDDQSRVASVEVVARDGRLSTYTFEYVEEPARGPGFPLPVPYGEFFDLHGRSRTAPAGWVWPLLLGFSD